MGQFVPKQKSCGGMQFFIIESKLIPNTDFFSFKVYETEFIYLLFPDQRSLYRLVRWKISYEAFGNHIWGTIGQTKLWQDASA